MDVRFFGPPCRTPDASDSLTDSTEAAQIRVQNPRDPLAVSKPACRSRFIQSWHFIQERPFSVAKIVKNHWHL